MTQGHDKLRQRYWTAPSTFAALVLLVCGTGCGPVKTSPPSTASAPSARTAEPEAVRVVSGEAIVISANAQNGLLSLRQAPLVEMGWPEMNIAYVAAGEALTGLSPGDHIAFDLELGGGGGGFVLATRKL